MSISLLFGCQKNSGDFELHIAHIDDTHSHISSETYSLYFDDVKTYTEIGGYGRVVSKIKEIQNTKKNVLTLNAGDTFQGTMYYSLFEGDADAKMLNMIEWDAIELGNHEFDDGDTHLAEYLGKLTTESSKILASNIEVPSTDPLYKKFAPYTIKEFAGGEKVAIIGVDTVAKTKYSSNPSDKVIFTDELTTIQKYVDEVKRLGINKIVLLSHIGLKNDKEIASKLDGVDIIIGGDSHSLMGDFSQLGLTADENYYPYITLDKNAHAVCIGHAWQYNYVVGDMDVIFDADGVVKSCMGEDILLSSDKFQQKDENGSVVEVSLDIKTKILNIISKNKNIEVVKEDLATLSTLSTYSQQVDAKKAEVIGYCSQYLGHNRIPNDTYDKVAPLPLGSDIAPIVAKSFYELSNLADGCIQNAGGVRTPIEVGNITIGDAYTLLPFANTLYEIKMTGGEIKQVLTDAVDEAIFGGVDNVVSTGAFPYAYGLRYDVDTTHDRNNTILNLEILDRKTDTWSNIDISKTYTIVTNSYIAGGKDGYITFKTVLDADSSKGTNTYLDYAMSFVKYVENTQKDGKSIEKLPSSYHPIKSFK